MEKRGEDQRDIGIPNFMGYNQESPVKLPLAPIVSTPPDRRGNATVSTRRGSAIFSPTQTLDHHRTLPLPLPLPPLLVQKDSSIPAPDPDQVTSPGGVTGGASNSKSPPPPPQQTDDQESGAIRYRECLKNHAAKMGGHVVDGCGEFMPSGDLEGTPEFLRCAACDCHRNFHRKQVQGGHTNNSHRIPVVRSQSPPPIMPSQHHNYPPPPVMVAFGGNSGGAAADSSSEDLNIYDSSGGGHAMSLSGSKKRFRTKFSQEQKDKMHELAGKLGWRIQKQDEQQVQHLCNEVGVKREVFKVWLHNNKQAMKKRQI